MDQKSVIETENLTREPHEKSSSLESQLRAVSRESHALQVQTRGKPFAAGNRLNALRKRKPRTLPEELDAVAKEMIRRLRSRNPRHQINPAAANAVSNLLRLRLELFQQFEVAEEAQRLRTKLEELQARFLRLKTNLLEK
jgi:hypothetical protein